MPKETKGKMLELRFRIGVVFVDFLEKIAGTNLFGNSVGEVVRHMIEDQITDYYDRSQEFQAKHDSLRRGTRKRHKRGA